VTDSEDDRGESSRGSGEASDESDRSESSRMASGERSDARAAAEEQWRFSIEDIESRAADAEAAADAERRRREPIRPGSPSPENVAFVVLGVLFALFVLSRLLVG
jgi:hypothetical protein